MAHFMAADAQEANVEVHKATTVRSYERWNPCGMNAVCGKAIMQDTDCKDIKPAGSARKVGAACGAHNRFM
jgi:hypothetical protein